MPQKKSPPCKRPYSLGKRLESSHTKRAKILATAREQLISSGFTGLTLDALARESGVTRQTIHNLFGTKSGVLESLFDQLALDAGMEGMRAVMQQSDPALMLTSFVSIFTGFWLKDRPLIRRIHGLAAVDPDFGAAIEARNKRRKMAAARVIQQLQKQTAASESAGSAPTLYALTSFEFFDSLAEACDNPTQAAELTLALAKQTFLPHP